MTNIELSAIVKKRFDVLLNYERPPVSASLTVQEGNDLFSFHHSYSITSVRIFPRLHNPNLIVFFRFTHERLHCVTVVTFKAESLGENGKRIFFQTFSIVPVYYSE